MPELKLHEMDAEADSLLENIVEESINPETGEIIDDFLIKRLDQIKADKEHKCLSIAALIDDYKALSEAHKAMEAKQKQKKISFANHAKRLEKYLRENLEEGKEKYRNVHTSIGWRKGSEIVIVGCKPETLPDEFKKVGETTARKNEIKAAIKAGREVKGCWLERGKPSLQIG